MTKVTYKFVGRSSTVVEHSTLDLEIEGSNPGWGENDIEKGRIICFGNCIQCGKRRFEQKFTHFLCKVAKTVDMPKNA